MARPDGGIPAEWKDLYEPLADLPKRLKDLLRRQRDDPEASELDIELKPIFQVSADMMRDIKAHARWLDDDERDRPTIQETKQFAARVRLQIGRLEEIRQRHPFDRFCAQMVADGMVGGLEQVVGLETDRPAAKDEYDELAGHIMRELSLMPSEAFVDELKNDLMNIHEDLMDIDREEARRLRTTYR